MIQMILFVAVVCAITKPLGLYLYQVFIDAKGHLLHAPLQPVERLLYRLIGVDPTEDQDWRRYASSVLIFSSIGVVCVYALLRLQHLLPLNPQHFAGLEYHLAFNTAASFVSNTNWQAYSGESTMGYLSQVFALTPQNFLSAASGMAVALAFARGLTQQRGPDGGTTLGNFWVDMVRGLLYVLLPLSFVCALLFVSQGVLQNFNTYLEITTLEGDKQVLPMGPVASQEAIKQLGTNGGGFFNANSAHPFENPNAVTNFLQMLLIFAIPAALTYTYGKMTKDSKQGWIMFIAMGVMYIIGLAVVYHAELGNLEGKETRFGIAISSIFATATTATSCGAVNSMHDSLTPLGGLVALVNMQLGEIIFGGVGTGLYGMLIFVLLAVFIAGLMVGRTPEYLGKKIEAREMKLAVLYILIYPCLVLGFSAVAVVQHFATQSLGNAGPHGLSEILYAYSSAAANNGSAFAGLDASTPWWNITLGITMLLGRFLMMIPVLAIAGSMVNKKIIPAGSGTFPTNGLLFGGLLIAIITIVGALTFFPALCLGPIVEHFSALHGRVF